MERVSFYKPNAKVTGSAAQFCFGLNNADPGLYISIIKQASWNDKTKRGSFSENVKNPNKNKTIKLNSVEAAALIRVLSEPLTEWSVKWSTVHKTTNSITSLTFSPYTKDGIKLGYGFSISEKEKESFMLSLTLDEGKLLEIFLKLYIEKMFSLIPENASSF